MHEFSKRQRNWFMAKDIKKADQTKHLFVTFSNNRKIDKYIDNNETHLAALEFDAFVADLRGYALEEDWAKKVLTELMSKKLRQGMSFVMHSQDIIYLNRLLEGTAKHQSDTQLRSHVTNQNIVTNVQNTSSGFYAQTTPNTQTVHRQQNPNVMYPNQLNQSNAPNVYHNPNNFYNRQQDNGYQNRVQNQFPNKQYQNRNVNQQTGGYRQLQQVDKRASNYNWPPGLQQAERGVTVKFNGCLGCC
ncbi:hypothetical protein C8J56DRAFT_889858 [Mycena floridula]|nr:hypothetical protein C8J56DRAFT_889858 [Mycena floridula]